MHVPDPIVSRRTAVDPEQEAVLADSVGLALLVVLDTLTPAERLAFVLHDMFAVPFEEIAPDDRALAGRGPAAGQPGPAAGAGPGAGARPRLGRQREVVDAFFAAARDGDFDALVAVLDPDVVLRADGGAARARPTVVLRGARRRWPGRRSTARAAGPVRPAGAGQRGRRRGRRGQRASGCSR